MIASRGLNQTNFLQDSSLVKVMPLILTVPISAVDNPHIEGSIDINFIKAT